MLILLSFLAADTIFAVPTNTDLKSDVCGSAACIEQGRRPDLSRSERFRIQERSSRIQVEPSPVRPPSAEYRDSVQQITSDWHDSLPSKIWQTSFCGLQATPTEVEPAFLPHYLNVSQDSLHLTIGLTEKIDAAMSASEVEQIIAYIASDGYPIAELSNADWTVKALTPKSHVAQGIEVAEFSNGRLVLRIQPEFFAAYGRDTRVIPPSDAPMHRKAYFHDRYSFSGDITLEISIDGLASQHSANRSKDRCAQ